MPPALDRLLASPPALRLLRSLVYAPEWHLDTAGCARCRAPRCHYSSATRGKWPRWKDTSRSRDYDWRRGRNEGVERQNEIAEWAQELQLQERLHGLNGIRDAWNANRTRHLPTEDTPDAEFLWGTFLRHPDLVFPIISHAAYLHRTTGTVYPHIYELCMGHWLVQERRVGDALEFHHQMLARLKLQELPLRHLARLGSQRFAPKAYEAFMDIYQDSNERDVYDEVIPALLARGSTTMVKQWHTLCVRRGDLPSSKVATHPLVRALTAELPVPSAAEAGVISTVAGTMQGPVSKLNDQLLRRLQGRDIAPVRFDDATCARMFATKAFAPDAVIKGIAMVGVNEIGPLAVRAMAARTDPIFDLPRRFEELRAVGIALQGCIFSLALEKFAMEKQWLVVRSMLESDQHPEVYDDRKMQKELLLYYVQQQDWAQAHRTLAVLSLFHNDSSTESWNVLLQAHIKCFNPHRIFQTLQTMRDKDAIVTSETILAVKACLRGRRRGHKPGYSTRGKFDDLRFVVRVFISILEGGIGQIPPTTWREIIRRYGMLGRFRELRRLIFWLMCWYAPRNGTKFDTLPKPPLLDRATAKLRAAYPQAHDKSYFNLSPRISQQSVHHPVRQLFPHSFQQGLIVWGFRAGLLPNASLEQSMLQTTLVKMHYRSKLLKNGVLNRLEWHVGLRTLIRLRDMGLHVNRYTVVKALQMMLHNLFGRGRSFKKENRAMRAANTIPYAEYVHEVNRIWGSPLFSEPHLYGRSNMHALMWHPRFERQVGRTSFLRLGEIEPASQVRDDSKRRRKFIVDSPDKLNTGVPNMDNALNSEKRERASALGELELAAAAVTQPLRIRRCLQRKDPDTETDGLRNTFLVQSKAISADVHSTSAPEELERASATQPVGRRRPYRRRTTAPSTEYMASDSKTLDSDS